MSDDPESTVTEPVAVHPPLAVTVTEYIPGAVILMLEVISPVLHRKSI